MQTVKLDFEGRYVVQSSYKDQIVLHHTVSGNSAQAVVDYWKKQPKLIGTPYLIDRQGVIYQLFDDRYWAGHVGDTVKDMQVYNLIPRNCSKNSLGVELLSMGGLRKDSSGDYVDYYGHVFRGEVEKLDTEHRGYFYFEKYTTAQLDGLAKLLSYWKGRYSIPMVYRPEIFGLMKEALNATPGLYTHCSFRQDKSDLYPSKELISMLKTL